MIFFLKKKERKKRYHTTTVSSPPMRQTKSKLIRQRTQHKREKNEKRTEKESNPGLKESQGSFWMPAQHLHSAADMRATLFLIHPTLFFLFKTASAAWLF